MLLRSNNATSAWLGLLASFAPALLGLFRRKSRSERPAARPADQAQGQPGEKSAERRCLEQELRINRFVEQAGRLHELDAILSYVAKQLSRELPVGRVAIFLAENPGSEPKLVALARQGENRALPQERLPYQGLVDKALERGMMRSENPAATRGDERLTTLALPLPYAQKTIGVVLFEELKLKGDGSEEITLAQRLAELAAVSIGNAQARGQHEQRAQAWERTFAETWAGFSQAIENVADPVFVHAPDYTILRFNKAFQHRVARPASAILGQKCYDVLFHKQERCSYCPYRREEQAPAAHMAEVPQLGERGTLRILSVSRVSAEGQNQGALEIVRDSSVELRLQEQLLHSEKLASIGKLVSGVAHELNNPLTAILGHAQLLERRTEDLRIKEKVRMILDEAGRASKIVRNLLTFARKHRPEPQVTDLNEVIRKTLALREYELKANAIQSVLKLSPALPAVVGDFQQLQQVLLNLISNAEHAMLDAHGQGTMVIESFAEEDCICFKVQDDGPGIPPEIRQRIFDPFFTTKPLGKGTGLGLSICFGILSEHKGTITVESEVGGGAAFVVSLPVAAARVEELVAEQPGQPFLLPHKRVLIHSADSAVCDKLEDMLKPAGAWIEIESSGEQSLAKCLSGAYDLVFAEWGMPEERQVVDWLREDRPQGAARCILLTNKASLEDVRKFCEFTGASWLQKPVMFAELRIVVEKILRQASTVSDRRPSS